MGVFYIAATLNVPYNILALIYLFFFESLLRFVSISLKKFELIFVSSSMCSSLLIITDFELKPYWNLYIFIRVKICWKLIWKWQIWTAWKDAYIDKGVVTVRSRRPEVFFKKGVLRNFPKFTGKHLCQSLFFNKLH